MRKLFLLATFCLIFVYAKSEGADGLNHVKGCQSVGVRGGRGTKSNLDIGLTYTYCFSNKLSLTVEADMERGEYGHSDFLSLPMISPCLEFNVWNPANWFYLSIGGGVALSYDTWECLDLEDKTKNFSVGPQLGVGFEFLPVSFLSFVLKAQQYAMFNSTTQYLKPNFTLALRYNFHK